MGNPVFTLKSFVGAAARCPLTVLATGVAGCDVLPFSCGNEPTLEVTIDGCPTGDEVGWTFEPLELAVEVTLGRADVTSSATIKTTVDGGVVSASGDTASSLVISLTSQGHYTITVRATVGRRTAHAQCSVLICDPPGCLTNTDCPEGHFCIYAEDEDGCLKTGCVLASACAL